MLRYASHLDILFMRSRSKISYLHRFFMRSHYNHVGILLKDEMEKAYLLEVVSERGVIISPLSHFLSSCHEDYEEIGYRKLVFPDGHLSVEMLERYINSLLGKKYELSLSKILLDNESVAGADQVVEMEDAPEKTYFCS